MREHASYAHVQQQSSCGISGGLELADREAKQAKEKQTPAELVDGVSAVLQRNVMLRKMVTVSFQNNLGTK